MLMVASVTSWRSIILPGGSVRRRGLPSFGLWGQELHAHMLAGLRPQVSIREWCLGHRKSN